jgi:hypothetical protein
MTDAVVQQESTCVLTASQRRAARLSGAGKAPVPPPPPEPSRDTIARRAYEIYVKAGSPEGHFEQSWRQAQQDLYLECRECQEKRAGQKCCCAKPPGPHAISEPAVKAVASDSPSVIGARDSTRSGAAPMPPEGRETPAQAFPRLAT